LIIHIHLLPSDAVKINIHVFLLQFMNYINVLKDYKYELMLCRRNKIPYLLCL
jgi:hypothetical protein